MTLSEDTRAKIVEAMADVIRDFSPKPITAAVCKNAAQAALDAALPLIVATQRQEMTQGQYRALVAYLNYWTPMYPSMGLDEAIKDIGIKQSRNEVIAELSKAGHDWDDEAGELTYGADAEDVDE